MTTSALLLATPPSRDDNPFATCWTRPGAMPFQFAAGTSAEQLVDLLAAQDWWGAIVGPHGCGKSTLLETLTPLLSAASVHVRAITLQNGQRRLPSKFMEAIATAATEKRTLVIIDGYEQLAWLERLRLHRRCRRAGCGLLVTAHAATRIPTLIRLAPDERLVQLLVADLASRVSTRVSAADVTAIHACHGSNVRETFFGLYDRHEELRRQY
jgi:ABC-type branched-subunit amino acid transport system ATPase component